MDVVDQKASAFCNRCGAVVSPDASACPKCGAGVVPTQPSVQRSPLSARQRKGLLIWTIVIGTVFGVPWIVLAAAVLLRTYSFFETVVVTLLVMILSAVAITRADFERSQAGATDTDDSRERAQEIKVYETLGASLRSFFYAIVFIMALVKLVFALW